MKSLLKLVQWFSGIKIEEGRGTNPKHHQCIKCMLLALFTLNYLNLTITQLVFYGFIDTPLIKITCVYV